MRKLLFLLFLGSLCLQQVFASAIFVDFINKGTNIVNGDTRPQFYTVIVRNKLDVPLYLDTVSFQGKDFSAQRVDSPALPGHCQFGASAKPLAATGKVGNGCVMRFAYQPPTKPNNFTVRQTLLSQLSIRDGSGGVTKIPVSLIKHPVIGQLSFSVPQLDLTGEEQPQLVTVTNLGDAPVANTTMDYPAAF